MTAVFELKMYDCVYIKYLVSVIDDPEKLRATPDYEYYHIRLLLISHNSTFAPTLHNLRGPLNELLRKDPELNCEPRSAADVPKYAVGMITSHIFLDNPEKSALQAYRTRTTTKKNYGLIEEQFLVIIFAVRQFHSFLYSRKFTLLMYHKPLPSIFGAY
ncbi:unnamed protein product [Hymenolepis diminuta]|uniref:RT_RNaseH domain-containing protein n=1 Tax=Hymenolepis diminuta TaxID=6216 RepID=A0A0R3S7L6_HYMDI|nr:unnamed protein product [Hymenolepis diminuta]VUZ44407.1 unnamed protein product [Hymenolepis diminuta]